MFETDDYDGSIHRLATLLRPRERGLKSNSGALDLACAGFTRFPRASQYTLRLTPLIASHHTPVLHPYSPTLHPCPPLLSALDPCAGAMRQAGMRAVEQSSSSHPQFQRNADIADINFHITGL